MKQILSDKKGKDTKLVFTKILIFRFIPIESSFLHLLIFILNFCHVMYYITTTKFLTEYSIFFLSENFILNYENLWE